MPEGIKKKINRKLTIGKAKKMHHFRKVCIKCNWRKVNSNLSNKCTHCISLEKYQK